MIRPEQVIDKLTERITDRLRNELKVELQVSSASASSLIALRPVADMPATRTAHITSTALNTTGQHRMFVNSCF
jgi:hypothetical protein